MYSSHYRALNDIINDMTAVFSVRQRFAMVENDNMLLSVTVITVASYLLDQRRTDKVAFNDNPGNLICTQVTLRLRNTKTWVIISGCKVVLSGR